MSLRVGIVGAGGMLHDHVLGYRAAGADVLALADIDPAAGARGGARENIPRVYPNAETMLRDCPELEAVSIVVPNAFHAPLTIAALRAGKHVFCEKPPALDARQAAAMAVAAKRARKVLMFDFNNRARPESFAMMDYIKRGAVGRINSAQARWVRRTGIPGFGGWFTNKAIAGGGPLIDLLHVLDLALYYMDYPPPAWVLAQTFNDFIRNKAFKGPWGIPDVAHGVTNVETACHGFLRLATGQVISFEMSWAEMVKREEVSLTFQGTKAGGLVRRTFGIDGIDDTKVDECELYVQEHGRSVNRSIVVPSDARMGRVRSVVNFVRAVEGTEAPLNTPDQAVTLMKILGGAYQSAKSGRSVRIR